MRLPHLQRQDHSASVYACTQRVLLLRLRQKAQ
jgi:hypothetical protein